MKQLLTLTLLTIATLAYSQKQKKADIESIKSMCGCYDISFNFAETFSPKEDYEYHDNYTSGALEYAFVVEESKDKVVIQHLLVIMDTMIIKHWRQDWLYENTDLYTYDQGDSWKYKSLDPKAVKGQWTQNVYQVDDSPRYGASASWVHLDGKDYWESYADAPLPRREYTKRKDYNVMVRKNRHEITKEGWIHEQDNKKVNRQAGTDELIAWEKGWNTYQKVEESKCAAAKEWWSANSSYWADVRAVWDELFATQETLTINSVADNEKLYRRIFALGDEAIENNYSSEETRAKVRDAIKIHLSNDQLLSSK
ncbi:DUF6607 family protein [Marinoscillum pacificum]|uniref:DUF6607 family protein n=1 Tax=Marinoscillum pacificum TaxID=392723 RepID=UPI0021580080|nr:DUF6607 family protein [Marinoscillum pacificum]